MHLLLSSSPSPLHTLFISFPFFLSKIFLTMLQVFAQHASLVSGVWCSNQPFCRASCAICSISSCTLPQDICRYFICWISGILMSLFHHFIIYMYCYFYLFLQVMLILSGNLSFLNYLTIVPAIACFDDSFFSKFVTNQYYQKWNSTARHTRQPGRSISRNTRFGVNMVLVLLVAYLSIDPVTNLVSPRQVIFFIIKKNQLEFKIKKSKNKINIILIPRSLP
jgi:Lipase maturation factor